MDLLAAYLAGMRILAERVNRTYADGKQVKLIDLELPTGEVWTNEPVWSVPLATAGLLLDKERG